jgi:hypothetical protein
MTMHKIKVLSPKKLIAARGKRSRSEIVQAGGNRFTEQDLYNYEKGNNLPKRDKEPFLLDALGVSFEDVCMEVSAARA